MREWNAGVLDSVGFCRVRHPAMETSSFLQSLMQLVNQ